MIAMAHETAKTVEIFHRAHSDLDEGDRYFRFSVPDGLGDIGLEEASQKRAIIAATDRYLSSQQIYKEMKVCGKGLSSRKYRSDSLAVATVV
jgi:hypothetical protein